MKINLLDIKGFGKLNKLVIRPDDGFNIIFEENEAGKTTLQAFIRAMFYGLKSGRRSKDGSLPPLKHYKPWNSEQYSGVMEYTLDDNSVYRVGRNFEKGSANIYDGNANNVTKEFPQAKDVGPKFAEEHLGLDEETFNNSVFISQMQCAIGNDGRKTLIDKLSNLTTTGSEELSLSRAITCLETELLEKVGTDRSSVRPLNIVNNRLNELDLKKQEISQLNEKYLDTILEYQEKKSLLVKLNDKLKEKKKLRKRAKLNELIRLNNDYKALISKGEELSVELEKCNSFIEENKNYSSPDEETVSKAQLLLYDKARTEEEIMSLEEEIKDIEDKIQKTSDILDPEGIYKQKTTGVEEILKERDSISSGNKTDEHKKVQKYKGFGTIGAVFAAVFFIMFITTSAPDMLIAGIISALISIGLILYSSRGIENKTSNRIEALSQVLLANGFTDLNDYFSYKDDQIKYRSELDFYRQELYRKKLDIAELNNKLNKIDAMLDNIIEKVEIKGFCDKKEAIETIIKGVESLKKVQYKQNMLLSEKIGLEEKCKIILREAAAILGKPVNSIEEIDKVVDEYKTVLGDVSEEIDEIDIDEEINLLEEQIKGVELQTAALEAKLEEAPSEGELARVMEEIELCKEKKQSLEKLGDSLSLAIEILNETALKLQRDFTPALNREISMYMDHLSSSKYQKILADDKLQINIEVPDTDELILVNRLSGGTVDQVYFSMRMASVSLMEKGREKLPIFLDEPFSQYDENRVRNAFELLKEISKERQVFFFTCREREFELAREIFGEKMNRIRIANTD
ncbi:MAG: AAA family ATPase [Clostridiaceae bacterium]|nr:AAA family ATPase [Clostridiaceae bacterium]